MLEALYRAFLSSGQEVRPVLDTDKKEEIASSSTNEVVGRESNVFVRH